MVLLQCFEIKDLVTTHYHFARDKNNVPQDEEVIPRVHHSFCPTLFSLFRHTRRIDSPLSNT